MPRLHKPRRRGPRSTVQTQVDLDVRLTLEMIGIDIPVLLEETLKNVANLRRCPCCKRELRPVITGRNWRDDEKWLDDLLGY